MSDAVSRTAKASIRRFIEMDVQCQGRASAQWTGLLRAAYPTLGGAQLEQMLLALVTRCWRNRREMPPTQLHQFVEFWSGTANLTLECLRAGLRGVRFDLKYCPDCDSAACSEGPSDTQAATPSLGPIFGSLKPAPEQQSQVQLVFARALLPDSSSLPYSLFALSRCGADQLPIPTSSLAGKGWRN